MKIELKFIIKAAIIASIYAALTILLMPISYGPIQVRSSRSADRFTVLYIGSNSRFVYRLSRFEYRRGLGWMDIIFGSLLPLISIHHVPYSQIEEVLVPLPAVIVNGIVVGWVVSTIYTESTLPFRNHHADGCRRAKRYLATD